MTLKSTHRARSGVGAKLPLVNNLRDALLKSDPARDRHHEESFAGARDFTRSGRARTIRADRLTAVYLDERVALLELSVGSTTQ